MTSPGKLPKPRTAPDAFDGDAPSANVFGWREEPCRTCPSDIRSVAYSRPVRLGSLWCLFGTFMACTYGLIFLDVVPLGVGISAMMLCMVVTFGAFETIRAINLARRQITAVVIEVADKSNRDRAAEYGAIMRKIASVGTQAEDVLGDWGQRVEDMYVACDAAEARRNVERTSQLTALRARVDEMSETFAGELLCVNGALNGVRASVDALTASQTLPVPSDGVTAALTTATVRAEAE